MLQFYYGTEACVRLAEKALKVLQEKMRVRRSES